MKIRLRENMFSDREQLFLEDGELKAYLFRFESGVCGIKLENSLGYITVLPYQGQMVWDAVFRGRSLKMQNSCHFPRFRKEFRDTYGCYVMHCGILRMGCQLQNRKRRNKQIPIVIPPENVQQEFLKLRKQSDKSK